MFRGHVDWEKLCDSVQGAHLPRLQSVHTLLHLRPNAVRCQPHKGAWCKQVCAAAQEHQPEEDNRGQRICLQPRLLFTALDPACELLSLPVRTCGMGEVGTGHINRMPYLHTSLFVAWCSYHLCPRCFAFQGCASVTCFTAGMSAICTAA